GIRRLEHQPRPGRVDTPAARVHESGRALQQSAARPLADDRRHPAWRCGDRPNQARTPVNAHVETRPGSPREPWNLRAAGRGDVPRMLIRSSGIITENRRRETPEG